MSETTREWNGERILSEIDNAVGDASHSVHDSTEWWEPFFHDGSSIYDKDILPTAKRIADAFDAILAERDEWKRRYFLVADAVAPSSENAEHLADIARQTRAEQDAAVRDYEGACKLVAQMHHAATGEVRGPIRGVVEDVADLRARLAACVEIFEWLLGERGEFPARPEKVEGKPHPLYWWRSELRQRVSAAVAAETQGET